MSILFVLLTFLLVMTITYFRGTKDAMVARPQVGPPTPRLERSLGVAVPQGYCFHPGHTWMAREGADYARVGLDGFAANLLGTIDRVETTGENRWVRQGQKLFTVHSGSLALEFLSPVEGVVTAINPDVMQEPGMVTRDPYERGWVATVKAPDLDINQNNLVQGGMVGPWMQNNLTRLNGMVAEMAPAMAADGGVPLAGLLQRVAPEVRQRLVSEFFLA